MRRRSLLVLHQTRAFIHGMEAKTGESQISLTDPDSRAMAAHTKTGIGYIQLGFDAKHEMNVEQAVTIVADPTTSRPARVRLRDRFV
jgi:hypothetical protein